MVARKYESDHHCHIFSVVKFLTIVENIQFNVVLCRQDIMYKKIVVKNLDNSFLRLSAKGAKFDDTKMLLE